MRGVDGGRSVSGDSRWFRGWPNQPRLTGWVQLRPFRHIKRVKICVDVNERLGRPSYGAAMGRGCRNQKSIVGAARWWEQTDTAVICRWWWWGWVRWLLRLADLWPCLHVHGHRLDTKITVTTHDNHPAGVSWIHGRERMCRISQENTAPNAYIPSVRFSLSQVKNVRCWVQFQVEIWIRD